MRVNTLGIIQARLNSRRLPGKVLLPLGDKPLLFRLVERLQQSQKLDLIVVATSSDARDDSLVEYCQGEQIRCERGPLEDVASRFYQVLAKYEPVYFARICADSPFYDPALVDRAITLLQSGEFDMVTNTLRRTFPKGNSVEVLQTSLFLEYYPYFAAAEDYEHVTSYFYRNSGRFRIKNMESSHDLSHCNLCIDTQEDYERAALVFAQMTSKPPYAYNTAEVLALYGYQCA